MGDIADMMMESFIDDSLYIFDELFRLIHMGVSRAESKRNFEDSIRRNEEEGFWMTSKKTGQEKILFKDLTLLHMKKIYSMLNNYQMYIPIYIKNAVENENKSDFLNSALTKEALKNKSVVVLDNETNCNNCPLCYFNTLVEDEDGNLGFGSYGDDKYYCGKTKEQVDYQYKNKLRGWNCPIKVVK